MRSLTVGIGIAVWCVAAFVPGLVQASPVTTHDTGGVSNDSPQVIGDRLYMNGFVEFSLNPQPDLTPPPLSLQRPADKTVFAFLRANLNLLGIQQDPGEFWVSSVTEEQPNLWVVTVSQTYQSYDVDTANLVFTVQGHTVIHVQAHFIVDVSSLPICAPNDGLRQTVDAYAESLGFPPESRSLQSKLFYRPYGSETHLAMLESMDVSDARLLMVVDVCNGVILDGYTERLTP
jgi:hypothetical protein